MKSDDATLKAHAQYFVKFVKAYAEQGIKIEVVAPQNEPNYSQNYPSCIWSASTFTTFVGKYLGPALDRRELPPPRSCSARCPTPTAMRTSPSRTPCWPMRPPRATARSWACSGACRTASQISNLKSKGPGIPIWLSEHQCGGQPGRMYATAPNDHQPTVWSSWGYIRDAIKNGVTSYNAWNMVLEQGRQGHRQHARMGAKRPVGRGFRPAHSDAGLLRLPPPLPVRRARGHARRRNRRRRGGFQEPRRQPRRGHVQ